jgi:hypothetical protein
MKLKKKNAIFKFLKNYTLAGFEYANFCSVGGDDDHYTTQPLAM